jgi:beta-aspartyl-peptidase (threonine type)
MEDDETFNAGRGSFLSAEGQVELDAGCIEGSELGVGAVAGVQFIRNPIRLARTVMERGEHVLLIGRGAHRFAHKMGFHPCELTDLAIPSEFQRWQRLLSDRAFSTRQSFARPSDTVGCVALDQAGHLTAGTLTGSTPNKMQGRVGDVPMVGCGFYADDQLGAASTTGWGASIAKALLARLALHGLEGLQDPQKAAKAAIELLADKVHGLGRVILLSPEGQPGWHCNTHQMAYAHQTAGMIEPAAGM